MNKYLLYLITLNLLIYSTLYYIYKTPFKEAPLRDLAEQTEKKDFISSINLPKGTWRYGGSTSWAPIRKIFEAAIKITHPQFKLQYTDPTTETPSSGIGIKMLLNDELDFSLSSRSLKQEERQIAKQKGFKLKQIPVAVDGIAIAVNPNLNIPGLTVTQLRDIYTGKIRNWKEVGGSSLPITPYSRYLGGAATVEFFKYEVLRDKSFADNVKFIDTTTQALKKVAGESGAIYYASAPQVVPQCSVKSLPIGERSDQLISPYKQPFIPLLKCPQQPNQLNLKAFQSYSYPFSRPLYVIAKIDSGVEPVLREGQKINYPTVLQNYS